MMESLSKRQREVFYALEEFVQKNGYPPTMRDLAQKLGLVNPTAVKRMLDIFEDKGLLESVPGKSRALRLIHTSRSLPEEVIELPVLGRIVAGAPEEALENLEEKIPVPPYLADFNPKAFLLKVKGDSMEPELHEGDLVIIHPDVTVHPKEFVAALLDTEATVKQFLKKEGQPILHPLNPNYRDLPMTEGCKILGKVTGLLRKF